ncbi:hypothetical protein B1L04_08390 [Microcystis aeruginosa KW]|uniref:Uncharacterized protein n=1 Tax=Microcystis aeruginosa KW TaxID=1960155 RepID=A0A1V4BXD4_MICAE|nr:hypothetical protein B1L04_08390 [Microcystis aeruginosa KW]
MPALLNQGMNANCASYPKVSLGLGFKNPTKEDPYLKSATPPNLYVTTKLWFFGFCYAMDGGYKG